MKELLDVQQVQREAKGESSGIGIDVYRQKRVIV
jgi:hypothetical protein